MCDFLYSKGKDACSAEFDRTVTSRPLARGGQKILPKLEINDTVEFQGNTYIVRHITYNYLSGTLMTLGIEDYKAPPLAEESKPEEETETPKEETEPEEEDLFENPKMLDELQSIDKPNPDKTSDGKPSPDARKHFIDVAKAVYKDYQNIGKEQEFQKIYITSAWRSRTEQAKILFGKLEKIQKKDKDGNYIDEWTKNMYEYYGRTATSGPYIKVIQYLYDGVYEHKIDSVSRKIYLADLNRIVNVKDRAIFQGIIEEKYTDSEYVINSYKKSEFAIKILLTRSHVEHRLFNPSHHVSDTPNRNANALDIRILEIDGIKYKETADDFFEKHWKLGYSGYPGSNHHHMNYKKQS